MPDRSTAELMGRFYRGLKAGLTKDRALQQAQVDLIGGAAAADGGDDSPSQPFSWAAFQLLGDWR